MWVISPMLNFDIVGLMLTDACCSDYRKLKKRIAEIKESQSPSLRPTGSITSSRRRAQSPPIAAASVLEPSSNSRSVQRNPASPLSFVPSREGDRLSDRPQPGYGSSGLTPPLRNATREPSPPLEELPPPMWELPQGKPSSNAGLDSRDSLVRAYDSCFAAEATIEAWTKPLFLEPAKITP